MQTDITESVDSPVPPDTLKYRKFLLIVLGLVLVTHLVIWGAIKDNPGAFIEKDSLSYLDPAEALLEEGRFDTKPGSNMPESLRTPGYPAWIAGIYFVFGKSTPVLIFFQMVLFLGTLALLYLLTERLFDSRAALLAAVFLALDPSSLSYTFKILTETLATLLAIGLAFFIFKFFETGKRNLFGFLAGLILALAVLVRPTFYYFLPVLLVLFAVVMLREKVEWKKVGVLLMVTALPVILIVGGWQWRNLEKVGVFQVTTIRGLVLYLGKGSQIYEDLHQVGWLEAEAALNQKLIQKYPDWPSLPWSQKDAIYADEGKKMMLEHPWLAIKGQIRHMGYFFFAPGTTSSFVRMFDTGFKIKNFKSHEKWDYFKWVLQEHPGFFAGLILGTLYLWCMYMFLFSWVLSAWRTRDMISLKGPHILFLLLVVYIATLSSIGSGIDRYRVVVMPLLCMYAGAGYPAFLSYLRTSMKRTKKAG